MRRLASLLWLLLSCAARQPKPVRGALTGTDVPVQMPRRTAPGVPASGASGAPRAPPAGETSEQDRAIATTLANVAKRRALPALRAVAGRVVDRDEAIRLVRSKTERELPRHVLQAQGELFAALELTPADYPFVAGLFEMLKKNLAGFYDPDTTTMVLLGDLDDEGRDETLAHELVHALQDQHFGLAGRLKYQRGRFDALAAQSCLAEGDATSSTFDALQLRRMTPAEVSFMMHASVAFTEGGAATPRALQAALVAPYVDGYRFVDALRDRGGWAEVNRAWKDPPTSTEQVLHLDKYLARQEPLSVGEPTAATLGADWSVLDADVQGEQGLRIAMEAWATVREAAAAAAGWGGDRYAVLARDGKAGRELAVAWRIVFDDRHEAEQAARTLAKYVLPCRLRDRLGPLAWRHHDATLVIAAGPYRRLADGKAAKIADADCALAGRWLAELMR